MKDRYLFPAIFTYEEGYEIAVTFPDLPGCTTSGQTEEEAFKMAQEALGGHLYCMETDGEEIPDSVALHDVVLEDNEKAVLIEVYMPVIRLAKRNKAVNRTVTLPAWLNAEALQKNVNFSQLLQEALIDKLGLQKRG